MRKITNRSAVGTIYLFVIFLIPYFSTAATCQFITQSNSPYSDYGRQGDIAAYLVGSLNRPEFISNNKNTPPGSDIISRSENNAFVFTMNSEIDAMYSYKIYADCGLAQPFASLLDIDFITLDIVQQGKFFYRLAKSKPGLGFKDELQVYAYDSINGVTYPDASSIFPIASFIQLSIPNAVSIYYNSYDKYIYIATGSGQVIIYKPITYHDGSLELQHVKTVITPSILPSGSEVRRIKVVDNNVFLLAYNHRVNDSVTVSYLKLDENKNITKYDTYTMNDNPERHKIKDYISSFIVVHRKYTKSKMLPYQVFVYHRGIIHVLDIGSATSKITETQKKILLDMSAPLLTSPLDIINSSKAISSAANVVFATEKYQTVRKDLFSSAGERQTAVYPETKDSPIGAVSYYIDIGKGADTRRPADNLSSLIVNYP